MNNTELNNQKSIKTLSIHEVADRLNATISSAKNMLKKWEIQIYRIHKNDYVYEIDLDIQLHKPFVLNLKRKYPNKWIDMYRNIEKDEVIFNQMLMLLEEEPIVIHQPTTKVKLKSSNDKKLYDSLLL